MVEELERRLFEIFRGYLVSFPSVYRSIDDQLITAEIEVKSVLDAQLESLKELFDGFSVEPKNGHLRIYA